MKTHILFLTGLISILCCISCKPSSGINEEITEIIVNDTAQSISLKHEAVSSIKEIGIGDILIADTFLILNLSKETEMLHVYSLPHLIPLGAFLTKGEGPDEVIMPGTFSQHRKYNDEVQIIIRSFQQFTGVLNVPKSLKEKKTVFDKKITYNKPVGKSAFKRSSTSFLLNDSIFLINRASTMPSKEEWNNLYEIYDSQQDSILYRFHASNFPESTKDSQAIYYGGDDILRKDGKKVAVAYRLFNMIAIADIPTGKVKLLYTGGEKTNWERATKEIEKYYLDVQCNDKYIWILATEKKNVPNEHTRLDVFDWDGNYLYKASLDGLSIAMFSMDEKNGYMYAMTADDTMVRYDIKELLSKLPQ